MTEEDIQKLVNNQTEALPDTTTLMQSALEPLMPLLSALIIIAIIVSVAMLLHLIVSSIQKRRQHKAIMRIDQNLQKLVDAQQPASDPVPEQQSAARSEVAQ